MPSFLKPLAVGLPRVSSDKQFFNGESIETQISKMEADAKRDGVEIVRFFVECFSGVKLDRTVIDELLQFLDDHKEIKIVYIVQIDRFSRAGVEGYLNLKRELYKRGVELRDVMGIIQKENNSLEHLGLQYDWSVRSPSQTAEVMHADYANFEVSNILTRTIGQQIALERKGYQTRPPDFGFQNTRIRFEDGKEASIMEPFEPEATWVRTIFRLRAESKLSDAEISDRVNAMGCISRRRNRYDRRTGKLIGQSPRKQMYPQQVQRLVAMPIYAGIRYGKWTEGKAIKTKFDGLVSIELWNKANRGRKEIIASTNGSYDVITGASRVKNCYKDKAEFLLRHVVHCPNCNKPFLASKSRGKYDYFAYYHCARGHQSVRVSQKEFHETLGCYFDKLSAKPAWFGMFKEVVREVWVSKNKGRIGELKAIDEHIGSLRDQQSNLLDRIAVCNSQLVQQKLEEEIEALEKAILSAEKERQSKKLSEKQIGRFFEIAKHRMEHPREYAFSGSTKLEMLKIWGTIFDRPPSFEELEDRTPPLRLIYRLSGSSKGDKSRLASHLSAEWNTFVDEVLTWLFDYELEHMSS